MTHPLQIFPISSDEIERVVQVFYGRVRTHPELGPIFAAHIEDSAWAAHEKKIARFWRNAILKEQSYSGNPMQAHLLAGNVKPAHFAVWLGLFDAVLQAELPDETAPAFSALAHRIGRGLKIGLQSCQQIDGAPPKLF